MGRPTKYSQSLHERLVRRLRNIGYLETACHACGISVATVYAWMRAGADGDERFSQFYADIMAARAEIEEELVKRLQSSDEREDWKAAAWRLERMLPAQYAPLKDRKAVELQAELQRLLELVRGEMSEDAYGQLIAALAKHAGFHGVAPAAATIDTTAEAGTPELPGDAG